MAYSERKKKPVFKPVSHLMYGKDNAKEAISEDVPFFTVCYNAKLTLYTPDLCLGDSHS